MMRLAILDKVDVPITFMDNDAPKAMHYWDDELHEYVKGNASTYTFTADGSHEDAKYLVVGNKISFSYNNRDYYMNIVTVEQDENEVTVTSYSTTFEFLNEYVGAYSGSSLSFVDYINNQVNFEKFVTVDASAISDRRRSLSWDDESTILSRLYSIASGFDAEIRIEPVLSGNYTLKAIKITAVPEYDEANNRYGIGQYRNDIVIRWQKEINSIRRTIDATDFASCIRPYGNNNLTIASYDERIEKDSLGRVTYAHYKNDINIYAPLAKEQILSNTVNKNDGWIVRIKTYSTDDIGDLYAQAMKDIRSYAVPKATYDVDGYFDTNIGDSVRVVDEGFTPALYLIARVSEQVRSFTDSTRNKTTFSNVVEMSSQIDPSLIARMNSLISESTKVTIDVSSTNGLVFKNSEGSSRLTAHVMRGAVEETSKYTFKWYKDDAFINITDQSFDVIAKDIDGKAVYKIEAIQNGSVITSTEVSAVNIADGEIGPQGPKGDKGDDGKSVSVESVVKTGNKTVVTLTDGTTQTTMSILDGENGDKGDPGLNGYVHLAWADSEDGSVNFSTTDSAGKLYIGAYTDNNKDDSTVYTDYKWTRIKGEQGIKGDPGDTGPQGPEGPQGPAGAVGRSLQSSTMQYYLSSSNSTPQDGDWVEERPEYEPGYSYFTRFKQVWDKTDGTIETTYTDPVYDRGMTMDANSAYVAKETSDAAKEIADNVSKTTDGKNAIFYQIEKPSDGTYTVNDLWFDTDDGNAMYYWTGSDWKQGAFGTDAIEDEAITNAKIANLDAGKITTGYLAADRIASDSIDASKIVSNSITSKQIAAGTLTSNEINVKELFSNDITATGSIIGAEIKAYYDPNSGTHDRVFVGNHSTGGNNLDNYVSSEEYATLPNGQIRHNSAVLRNGGLYISSSVYNKTSSANVSTFEDIEDGVYSPSVNPGISRDESVGEVSGSLYAEPGSSSCKFGLRANDRWDVLYATWSPDGTSDNTSLYIGGDSFHYINIKAGYAGRGGCNVSVSAKGNVNINADDYIGVGASGSIELYGQNKATLSCSNASVTLNNSGNTAVYGSTSTALNCSNGLALVGAYKSGNSGIVSASGTSVNINANGARESVNITGLKLNAGTSVVTLVSLNQYGTYANLWSVNAVGDASNTSFACSNGDWGAHGNGTLSIMQSGQYWCAYFQGGVISIANNGRTIRYAGNTGGPVRVNWMKMTWR